MFVNMGGQPIREINGLPYTVHQIGEHQWQVVIENCSRHPAGYAFAPVYDSYEAALANLRLWPNNDAVGGRSLDDESHFS